ncbi:jg23118 [Pararge aegeria aegeria]|uniref:Jg23118 protein n=1 Tax=Pararge aegeria aegeria TaxID=348720 RepID=A0A8S4QL18_9NEOP|nr:jg23118 [Pararge aegeria aegeria]
MQPIISFTRTNVAFRKTTQIAIGVHIIFEEFPQFLQDPFSRSLYLIKMGPHAKFRLLLRGDHDVEGGSRAAAGGGRSRGSSPSPQATCSQPPPATLTRSLGRKIRSIGRPSRNVLESGGAPNVPGTPLTEFGHLEKSPYGGSPSADAAGLDADDCARVPVSESPGDE